MRSLLTSIFLVSASAIAYEILLMRILSIVQWHHFAWMIISLALLGYAASGTILALARDWLVPRFRAVISVAALLLALSMVLCLMLGQRVPFNALQVVWDPRQLLYLTALYLLFMLPFLFAALCIGLAFAARERLIDRIYFSDLLGAGLGAMLIVGLLFVLLPQRAVIGLSALALAGSVLAAATASTRWRKALLLAQFAWLLGLAYIATADRIGLQVSPFKGLSQALEVVGARVVAERSGPLGLLTVVESPKVPFRHVPGLSFTTRHLPPDQLAVFTDGESISTITAFDGDLSPLGYLEDVTAALPYRLLTRPRVLVLGAGAGGDVLLALRNGARQIDAVELNPQMAKLVSPEFSDYSGNLYGHERVSLWLGEARGYVSRHPERYDLVQLALLDSFAVAGSGVQALGESYLYTVEAMALFLEHLEPGGVLAITRWLRVPPRDSLKLAATLIEAMQRSGRGEPGRRLAVIRNWNTVTLLAKNGEFSPAEIGVIRQFSRQHSFDTAWYPGMPPSAANQFNRLDRPWVYEGIAALLGAGAGRFVTDYKFNIVPASDDRPYFFNFFKWRVLPELLDLRKRGGAGLVEWGYLILIATLVQAALAGAVLILLPLWLARRGWPPGTGGPMGTYFFLLGLAFLFVEMAFIQRFILFLAHPLYSVAVVLAGFLVFAGLGSLSSRVMLARFHGRLEMTVLAAVGCIVGVALVYVWSLPAVFDRLIGLGDGARVLTSLALIAPLAFFMGMPFPLGLRRLSANAPAFIPWAWGLNGFASVISAALATLLAIEFGFTMVVLLALLFYVFAAIVLIRSASTVYCAIN